MTKPLKIAAFGLSLFLATACNNKTEDVREDYPPGESGTSEAIIKDNNNLANPRPAPIGDTAETEEQANQFGKLPSNVDSVARADQGLKKP